MVWGGLAGLGGEWGMAADVYVISYMMLKCLKLDFGDSCITL